ncbi:MAG: acetylornithine deacetylase, partial [Muribaculaceae bacterium]|nr:acetylornithine deacetylase [Muribaculaceae bacterium]
MNIPGYIELLQRLIATPSVSRQEDATAGILMDYMSAKGLKPRRYRNNVYALSSEFVPSRPTLLLNSHHDTVRP